MTQLGAYVGFPDSGNSSTTATTNSLLKEFTTAMGQAPTVETTYVDATLPVSSWVSQNLWIVNSWKSDPTFSNGVTPDLGLPMAQNGDSAVQDFQAIASGAWDSVYNQIFQAWADAGYKNFYIRPGWEMNGNWFNWSVTSSNAANFVTAFQHIATLAHNFSGATIKVVWNPNVGNLSNAAMASYYPGDAYVDDIGLDIAGAPTNYDASPQDKSIGANDVEMNSIVAFAQQHGKTFVLPEVSGGAGDTAFPTNLANELVALHEPVGFAGIWDVNFNGENVQWSSNAASAQAWNNAYQTINGIAASAPTPTPTPSPSPSPTPSPTPSPSPSPRHPRRQPRRRHRGATR